MPKAKKSADSTPKKATRSRKEVVASSDATAAATAPALESRSMETGSIEERIRARAYELFQNRNGQNGSPESDWCQAEAEVRATLDRTA